MPESIRNAIVVAFTAVLVAMVCVGLLLWRGRPAAPPPRSDRGLPLLVTDRDGGVSDLSVKLGQMERRLGETQVLSQRLMEQLQADSAERAGLTSRLAVLEREVRVVRKRLQESELRQAPKPEPVQTTPTPQPTAPATTTTPSVEPAPAPPP